MKISSIVASKGGSVITIRTEETVRQALRLFADHDIGALVVVDAANRPVGIITERGILRAAVGNERILSAPVGAVMTREVIVGHPEDDLMAVAHTMTAKRIRHLPIVEAGRLVGIVSMGDVLKAQRDQYRGQVDTLETRLSAVA